MDGSPWCGIFNNLVRGVVSIQIGSYLWCAVFVVTFSPQPLPLCGGELVLIWD